MQNIRPLLIFALGISFLLSSCGSSEEDKQNPQKGNPATNSSQETPKPENKELLPENIPPVKSDTGAPILNTVAQVGNFKERIKSYKATLFAEDFADDPMEAFDRTPIFDKASSAFYKRYRRKKAISARAFGNVIPRHVFKAWAFNSNKDRKEALLGWLNEFESSDESIELGEQVNAMKSPPFLVAVLDKEFYVLTSACMFRGPEWDALRSGFFELFRKEGAGHLFQVTCKAGELVYE